MYKATYSDLYNHRLIVCRRVCALLVLQLQLLVHVGFGSALDPGPQRARVTHAKLDSNIYYVHQLHCLSCSRNRLASCASLGLWRIDVHQSGQPQLSGFHILQAQQPLCTIRNVTHSVCRLVWLPPARIRIEHYCEPCAVGWIICRRFNPPRARPPQAANSSSYSQLPRRNRRRRATHTWVWTSFYPPFSIMYVSRVEGLLQLNAAFRRHSPHVELPAHMLLRCGRRNVSIQLSLWSGVRSSNAERVIIPTVPRSQISRPSCIRTELAHGTLLHGSTPHTRPRLYTEGAERMGRCWRP